jgi:hypothetical protein
MIFDDQDIKNFGSVSSAYMFGDQSNSPYFHLLQHNLTRTARLAAHLDPLIGSPSHCSGNLRQNALELLRTLRIVDR